MSEMVKSVKMFQQTRAILLLACLVSISDGVSKRRRFLSYNPADMSSSIGYQNHQVSDMTSLVDEASAQAHGGNSAQYNVPNFPAMGQNQVQVQTGSMGSVVSNGTGSVGSASGSASFHGTNHWRCDIHVVNTCDTECLDVDPKDGCPFCIPSCSSAISEGAKLGTGSGSGSPSQSAGNQQSPSTLTGSNQQGTAPQNSQSAGNSTGPFVVSGTATQTGQSGSQSQYPGSLSGTGSQGSQSGGLSQQSSGLSGTGSQGKLGTPWAAIAATAAPVCPYYPPNCPQVYTKLEKGCLECTILQHIAVAASTSAPIAKTTTRPQATCPPKRCVPPCDKGIVLAADGCPRCLCPAHV